MKALLFALFLGIMTALLAFDSALATEYFVVKSRSGILRIVNHQPRGGATILKGPFATKEEADKAIRSLMNVEAPHAER